MVVEALVANKLVVVEFVVVELTANKLVIVDEAELIKIPSVAVSGER